MRALYASVGDGDPEDKGAMHIGWIDGPQGTTQQKRCSIYIDAPEDGSPGWEVYAICVGPGDHSEMRHLHSPADVWAVLQEYRARCPEEIVLEKKDSR